MCCLQWGFDAKTAVSSVWNYFHAETICQGQPDPVICKKNIVSNLWNSGIDLLIDPIITYTDCTDLLA